MIRSRLAQCSAAKLRALNADDTQLHARIYQCESGALETCLKRAPTPEVFGPSLTHLTERGGGHIAFVRSVEFNAVIRCKHVAGFPRDSIRPDGCRRAIRRPCAILSREWANLRLAIPPWTGPAVVELQEPWTRRSGRKSLATAIYGRHLNHQIGPNPHVE